LQGALPVKMFDAAAYGVPSVVNQGCLMAEVALAEGIGCPAEWNDLTSVAKALFQARRMSVRLETTADRERRRWRKALLPVLDSLQ